MLGGLLAVAFGASINSYTILMQINASKLVDADPATTDSAKMALGKAGEIVQAGIYWFIGFSSMIAYLQAATDAVVTLLTLVGLNLSRQLVMLAVFFVLCAPTTFIRSLTNVATLSMVAFLAAVAMVIAIMGDC